MSVLLLLLLAFHFLCRGGGREEYFRKDGVNEEDLGRGSNVWNDCERILYVIEF